MNVLSCYSTTLPPPSHKIGTQSTTLKFLKFEENLNVLSCYSPPPPSFIRFIQQSIKCFVLQGCISEREFN